MDDAHNLYALFHRFVLTLIQSKSKHSNQPPDEWKLTKWPRNILIRPRTFVPSLDAKNPLSKMHRLKSNCEPTLKRGRFSPKYRISQYTRAKIHYSTFQSWVSVVLWRSSVEIDSRSRVGQKERSLTGINRKSGIMNRERRNRDIK